MNDVSARIRGMLMLAGRKQSDLMDVLDRSSRQSLSNKFIRSQWSADDLISVAEYLGCELCFILPNGDRVPLRHIKKDQA